MDKRDIEMMILEGLYSGELRYFKIPEATTIDNVQTYLFEEGLRKLLDALNEGEEPDWEIRRER